MSETALKSKVVQGSTDLYIHFTARNGPPGKYNEFPTPSGSSNIYINPIKPNWYLDGLPGRDGLEGTIRELRELIQKSGARRVTTIGSSMGAWGAAYYASMLDASTAILFGPELVLNCYGGFSITNLNKQENLPTITKSDGCRYITIAGALSPSDLFCSVNFFGGDLEDCYIIPRMAHGTSQELSNLGLLDRILAELAEGRSSILDMLQHPERDKIVPLFQSKADGFPALLEYVRSHRGRPGYGRMVLHIASDLSTKRYLRDASFLIEDATPNVASDPEAKAILLKCAQGLKQHDRALALSEELLLVPVHRQNALWIKGQALEAMGRDEQARDVFQLLCDEHCRQDIFVKAAAKLTDAAA